MGVDAKKKKKITMKPWRVKSAASLSKQKQLRGKQALRHVDLETRPHLFLTGRSRKGALVYNVRPKADDDAPARLRSTLQGQGCAVEREREKEQEKERSRDKDRARGGNKNAYATELRARPRSRCCNDRFVGAHYAAQRTRSRST